MKFLLGFILLTLAPLHAEPASVLAKIGDIEINSDEAREILAGMDREQQTSLTNDTAALNRYIRALLVQRLILKQAIDQNWDQEPAVIAKLVRARESALTESFLQNASAAESGYPSDAELESAYESSKSKLLVPRSFHLSQIFIAGDKAKLDATVRQLKAKGADFAAIARTNSEEATSATQSGEIGWLTEEQIQPGIRKILPKLKPGSVTEPIPLEDGWHILKVLGIREPHTPPLAQIRGQLAARLRAERAQLKRQEFLNRLVRENPIAINEIELGKISTKL